MSSFTQPELDYLLGERRLARIATADAEGRPHVTPVGMWHYDPDGDVIEVTGRDFGTTVKFRNVRANPHASLVVDDLASVDPWRPRGVMVQGPADALDQVDDMAGAVVRIDPAHVVSWGLGPDT